MNSILVVGAGGFIGQYLLNYFGSQVIPIFKDTVDVLDSSNVRNFLKYNKCSTVINCITYGGKKPIVSTDLKIVRKNLQIFDSFYSNRDYFTKYINIGSGVELSCNLHSYGVSKKIISDFCNTTDNFYTLRLFGCFGKGEPEYRLFTSYLKNTKPTYILQDKLFDNFSIQDFCKVIEYYVTEQNIKYKTIDCVYQEKISVSEQIRKLQKITGIYKDLIISKEYDYIGDSTKLDSLTLPLTGLDKGLIQYRKLTQYE